LGRKRSMLNRNSECKSEVAKQLDEGHCWVVCGDKLTELYKTRQKKIGREVRKRGGAVGRIDRALNSRVKSGGVMKKLERESLKERATGEVRG